MRWILAAALLAHGTARAEARLRLTSDRPIVIVVNLVPYTFGDGTVHTAEFRDGREGLQNVRVLNLLGQEVWSGQVQVPEGYEVKARWSGRTFEVYDKRRLQEAAPARLATHQDGKSGAARLDAIAANASTPSAETQTLDEVESLLRQAEPASGAAPPAESGPEPPPAGIPSRLRLVNRTTSWANVYVGDEKLEFRGGVDPVEVELPSGEHRVAFKDFQDKESWGEGRVWVYPDLTVELHFSKNSPPAALNKPEAWHPDGE